ncbi:hypothetical protein F383_37118 [Gossypium arboreum]|uniref:Uncharacterized protein n=1 Tax=Gossypium arboreum TaxID=29729 RepID=A0A0B0M6Y2_GOSAR|nr:hypothetical protein F383_37118 [Gossypium arboreum]
MCCRKNLPQTGNLLISSI